MKEKKRESSRSVDGLSERLAELYLHMIEKDPDELTAADMAHIDQLSQHMCELENIRRRKHRC